MFAPRHLLGAVVAAVLVVLCSAPLGASGVSVFVMMPLTMVSNDGVLQNPSGLSAQLQTLRTAGVTGVMTDMWWGIVEAEGPRQYNWTAYQQFVRIAASAGLQVSAIMSFHACGSNVDDACDIPIPQWAQNAQPTAFYTDREGSVDSEYISLGADNADFAGRTPIQIYGDFIESFVANILSSASNVVAVQVSLGPAGELRYPGYRGADSYPNVGEFQCYDPFMLANLSAAAQAIGQPQWGEGGPDDAGVYSSPSAPFWETGTFDNFESDYGMFFLSWYSGQLTVHADAVLGVAAAAVQGHDVVLVGKVSGVHWQYKTDAHAAECTAGYYNTNGNNGYSDIAQVFARHGAALTFTCMEMLDSEQCSTCGPQELVQQVHQAAISAGIPFAGENALPVFDQTHYGEIEYQARTPRDIFRFTYLRLGSDLLQPGNLGTFTSFVLAMGSE